MKHFREWNHSAFTLRAVGFSYAKRERNHCEQPSAFPSSMSELDVMHLMPSSVVNILFLLEVFRYKRIKMYLTNSADKSTIQFSLYFYYLPLIILRKLLRCFNGKTLFLHDFYVYRPLFRLSTIARKSQQSALKVAYPCLL